MPNLNNRSETDAPTVLIFDSGVGGLTVFREVIAARPDARYIYVADDAGFPYGNQPENALIQRIVAMIGNAITAHNPDLVVIACNTASVIALADLRARFSVPFVGTVPAIKPACAQSKSKRIAVLGTQATVSREYTRTLIREFAGDCNVVLVGSPKLASYAEMELSGMPPSNADIQSEIAPCFGEGPREHYTDTIVLACTHYPLLLDRFRALSPWSVDWIDPAPAIARRVVDLLHEKKTAAETSTPRIEFTSGRAPPVPLKAALTSYGFV